MFSSSLPGVSDAVSEHGHCVVVPAFTSAFSAKSGEFCSTIPATWVQRVSDSNPGAL